MSLTVFGLELARMRDDVETKLSSQTMTGRFGVEAVEHDFSFEIEIVHGRGVARGRVTSQFATGGHLAFSLTTDQSYLRETLRQLNKALSPPASS